MKPTRRRTPQGPNQGSLKPYEAEKHLRTFCNITSLELSNVIAAISGELNIALTQSDPKLQRKALITAQEASARALSLGRNLRYFVAHTRLDVHPVDLSQIILDAVDLVETDLEARNIKLEITVESSLFVTLDPGAIQNVIINLLNNAGNAMANGGQLTLRLSHEDELITISVSDTGVGIAAEKIERIFEPYYVGDGLPRFTQREGLGLSVSKALVEAHGGEINVESSPETGTQFTIHLPFDPNAAKPSPFLEKRRFRRVSLTLPAEVQLKDGKLKTEIPSLSIGGCYLQIPQNHSHFPEVGDKIKMKIFYYDDQSIEIAEARVSSRVLSGNHTGVGLEFRTLDERAKKMLLAIVKSHSS